MSNPAHPIVKMYCAGESARGRAAQMGHNRVRAQIAAYRRHVKPLLDALEEEHEHVEHGPCDGGRCPTCNLLARWRAKL